MPYLRAAVVRVEEHREHGVVGAVQGQLGVASVAQYPQHVGARAGGRVAVGGRLAVDGRCTLLRSFY